MSESDGEVLQLTGRSSQRDPAAALREALGQIAQQLAAQGCGPHHLRAMVWKAATPATFHVSRRDIELAYREIFVGFRPPLQLQQDDSVVLQIAATAQRPARASDAPVWRGLSLPQLAAQYSARSQVPDMQPIFRQWSKDGAAFRAGFSSLDLAYGPSRDECLDLYMPARAGRAPLWIFIHGGYWQAVAKEQNAQFAKGLVRAGFAVANLDYGLCPETPIGDSAAQIRRALNFITTHADALGIDAGDIHLVGHSAGAHLAGLLLADASAPPIRSALLISGLFDLAPLALLPMGPILGLTDTDNVARLSVPAKRLARPIRVALALGEGESDEFHWQSRALAERWGLEPPMRLEGRNHFTVLDGLIEGELLAVALRLAEKDR